MENKQQNGRLNSTILIISFNINGLNNLIKWQTGLKKQGQVIYCLQEMYFKYNDTNRIKIKR